jgi:hypothetical protein
MKEKASPRGLSQVEKLAIRECSFSFRTMFAEPRPLETVNLKKLTDTLLVSFREYNLNASDITMDRGDYLFGYSIKAQLFGGLISFVIGATGVDGNFSRLVGVADRQLAAAGIRKLIEAFGDGLSEFCFMEIALHADFQSADRRKAFFSRKVQEGLEEWGLLGYKHLDDPQQKIRVEVDQSWTYPGGAFFDWRTIGLKRATLLSFDPIWGKFFALLEPFDLELQDE